MRGHNFRTHFGAWSARVGARESPSHEKEQAGCPGQRVSVLAHLCEHVQENARRLWREDGQAGQAAFESSAASTKHERSPRFAAAVAAAFRHCRTEFAWNKAATAHASHARKGSRLKLVHAQIRSTWVSRAQRDRDSSAFSNSSHRFCVVTALTLSPKFLRSDLFEPYATVGMRGISAYTNRHGYTFHPIFFQGPNDEHPGWQRVRLTLQLLCMDACDWAFWMEGDMFITNYTRTLDDILATASPASSKHFVFSCDPTLNTGAGFIRNSANAIATLEKVLQMRITHGQYAEVMKIDHNGAFMILQHHTEHNEQLLLTPQRLFNSYPSNWKPGDLLVHFPGVHKKEVHGWLREHPPHAWDAWSNFTHRAQTRASSNPVD